MNPSPPGNIRILRTLIRKDWRFFRAPMVGLLILGVAPYLIMAIVVMTETNQMPWYTYLGSATAIATGLTALLASAFGGAAIAGERNNRTADFLDLLPVTRGHIALSKGVVSFVILAMCTVPQVTVAAMFSGSELFYEENWVNTFLPAIAMYAGLFSGFFGIAWLIGSFSRSAPISASVSIAITIGAVATIAVCLDGHGSGGNVPYRIAAVPLSLGITSLIVGTVYYLRRVEP